MKQFIPGIVSTILIRIIPILAQEIGVPVDSLPTWEERTLYMLINAVRLNPVEYGQSYCDDGNPVDRYSSRTPYLSHPDLNRAAHDHSIDMGSCNRMSHISCDGTSMSSRLRSYYGKSGAECIAHYYSTPMKALDAWLHSNAGHRDAVMSKTFTTIGCGHAETSRHWWTLDLSTGAKQPDNPLYGGSHQFLESGKTTFWVNFYSGFSTPIAPQSVTLILENGNTPMSPLFGKETNTTFAVPISSASQCRSYYFEAVDKKGTLWRYPESGEFLTHGEGACRANFRASAVSHLHDYRRIGLTCSQRGFGMINSVTIVTLNGRYLSGGMRMENSGVRSMYHIPAHGVAIVAASRNPVRNSATNGNRIFRIVSFLGR